MKTTLFKSVEHINRFKKQHFLNRFEKNNRFKNCTQGASPKNSTLQGVSNKIHPHYRGYQPIYPKNKNSTGNKCQNC
jgi:hypothetical protein